MTMKATPFILLLLLGSINVKAQSIDNYFEDIRYNAAELTAFFSAMPKGGDLHHHYSGSVYTETYINRVVTNDYFINKRTCIVVKDTTAGASKDFVRFSTLGDSLSY